MQRLPVAILLAVLTVSTLPAGIAQAGSVQGGALNAPGEKSHNVAVGFPEIWYVWEGYTKEKFALGARVGLQVWPLSISIGLNARITLREEGRVAVALLVVPSFNVAGFGGTRATYVSNFGFGRSRTFRASMGPGVNVGLLATVDVSPVFALNFGVENPVAVWVWTNPAAWWIEWPILITAGAEYEVSYSTSLFGRLGAGPSIAFAGRSQLLGIAWHAYFGVQIRY